MIPANLHFDFDQEMDTVMCQQWNEWVSCIMCGEMPEETRENT